jgi:hypothetical protein
MESGSIRFGNKNRQLQLMPDAQELVPRAFKIDKLAKTRPQAKELIPNHLIAASKEIEDSGLVTRFRGK